MRKIACAAALLAAAAHQAASGQVVRGRVVEAGQETFVDGAMVALEDRSGRRLTEVLARTGTGLFEFEAPGPGEYRVRAERIGYATGLSEWFRVAAADTLWLRVEAPVSPISLEGVVAEADRRCRVRPDEGMATARVWDEARKALAAAAWTQGQGMYRYEMLGFARRLDRDGRKIESEDRTLRQSRAEAPYVSRPADSLASRGFAELTADESRFWAPDAVALLSDSFLDTHCLKVVAGDAEAPGLVGLAFEPVAGRTVPEIAGAIWLDPSTSRLRRLDFRYENLNVPRALQAANSGGVVHFRGLPNGTWIVDSWSIRMFRAGVAEHWLTGRQTATLEGVTVQGGKVLRVHGSEGVVFEAGPGYRIAGVVRDSLGAGLPDARVFVPGQGAEVATGPDGAFELAHLQPGEYEITYSHPYLDELWYRPDPAPVKVEAADQAPVRVDFDAPPVGLVLEDVCRNVDFPKTVLFVPSEGKVSWPRGILMGHVRDAEGNPLPGAKVRVLSDAYDMRAVANNPAAMPEERRGGAVVETNASGFYRACWMPTDVWLQVAVLDPGEALVAGQSDKGHLRSNVVATTAWTIEVPLEEPHVTLDLRPRSHPPSS